MSHRRFSRRALKPSRCLELLHEPRDGHEDAVAKLKKAGIPDVDHGKQVARSFQTFLAKASTEISGALAQMNAADPTSPAFVDTVTQVTTQLTTLDSRLGDPFSKVESQDLLGAFKDQKACRGVVTIIGG